MGSGDSAIAARKSTLKTVTDYIVDVICKRSISGYNYGVILIPEELNEILAHEFIDEEGLWKKKLVPHSLELFKFLPPTIQEELMLEKDPHGNVQVAKIETEKMLIQMELTKGTSKDSFVKMDSSFASDFLSYEGRCGLPTNFDSTYCMLWVTLPGLFFRVGNLAAPVSEWTVGGTALTSLMDVERKHAYGDHPGWGSSPSQTEDSAPLSYGLGNANTDVIAKSNAGYVGNGMTTIK
ncbi:hypothetical protein MLD38_036818 [Melastoma candidum]|uniref:Uncharacterized protein n=1 Tax=Melastoma candidum TaxID=119954 RepID=A0ACB9LK58_9MYRT|nr:hypothetical protein MLD38_036818 [Melastoma candidum]